MLSLDDGKKAVVFARRVVETYVKDNNFPQITLGKTFSEKQGAFVTIHTYPDHNLRGCIGIPLPVMSLKEAIMEGAKSATRDPRFMPLEESEFDGIIIEVTILTKPEVIKVDKPEEYLSKIEIGRDGLIVEQGFFKGLLLPQVPIEQGWEVQEFISHTCMKAGLMPDAWENENTKIFKFSGQIFTEIEPRGKIEEKKLDGSCC
ncbi:MAG: TIGR00296 family protein [Thermoplasmatales archaeon]|nr:MAG: TIGR00296 family protein [Thermoplasmatales archaeon]